MSRNLTLKNLNKALKAVKKLQKPLDPERIFLKFLDAIEDGNFTDVNYYISYLNLFNIGLTRQSESTGETILHAAAKSSGGVRMCELLWNHGGNLVLNRMDKNGLTPLHSALDFENGCDAMDRDVALWFLKKGSYLVPFPDNTPIMVDLYNSIKSIEEYKEEHPNATHVILNNNNNSHNNNSNNNTASGSTKNTESNINSMNGYATIEESLENMFSVLREVKRLHTIYLRRLQFVFMGRENINNSEKQVIFADLRMEISQLIDLVKKFYVGKKAEIDLVVKSGTGLKHMIPTEKLAKYKPKNNTKVIIVYRIQTGHNTRKLMRR